MLVSDFENFNTACKENENELLSTVLASLEAPDDCFIYFGNLTIQDLTELTLGRFTQNMIALVTFAIENDHIDISDLYDEYAPDSSDYNDDDEGQELFEQDLESFDSDVLITLVVDAITDDPAKCNKICKSHLEQLKNIAVYSFLENLNPALVSQPKTYQCRNQNHEFVYLLNDSEILICLAFDNDLFSASLLGVQIQTNFYLDDNDVITESISRAMRLAISEPNERKYQFCEQDQNLTDYTFKSALNYFVCEGVFNNYYQDLLACNEQYGHSLFNEHSEVIDFLTISASSAKLRDDFCHYLASIPETLAVESLINNATSFDADYGKLIAQNYIKQFLTPDSNHSYFPSASLIIMAEMKDDVLKSNVAYNSECFLNTRIELALLPQEILLKHNVEIPVQQLHLGL